MTKKLKAGIIGSGNIGSDLMMKLFKSDWIEPTAMIGIDATSRGMIEAKELGLEVYAGGIDEWAEKSGKLDILFDATSAKAHEHNDKVAEANGVLMIDLTPAAIGPFVSPTVNLKEHLDARNVNMVTCGGQATTPIIQAINEVAPVEYAEIVATISSKSAGPGTRANIDEFTETTSKAIEDLGGAKKGKAIIVLNPADPPILMRDTIFVLVEEDAMNEELITEAIEKRVAEVQEYVPGYRIRSKPLFDNNKISVFVEVEGAGDFLPAYSGNLDIMTASAVRVAEEFAKTKVSN
ncbi:acetaldehyde dehydrogenase (acetylating) [Jeotgalibaca porci]|uniref:acetaldehyde dehydrogenase (acetylating) n=1 Tax=Jeotgalibaca porci TaxID=1868793 RepID=UPI0016BD204F|nr:acetaldehyde dehydrogenase (acetylating) [Lactobacillales bacterium]